MKRQMYRPLTPGHSWWLMRLRRVLAPAEAEESWFTRAVAVFFVVPFAPLTPLDLTYQTYLYEVFHRSRFARLVHLLLFPLVNITVMVGLAAVAHGDAIFAGVLALWYAVLALRARSAIWGVSMLGAVAAMWAANVALQGVLSSPWLWAAGLSLAIAASHITEPDVPPRVSGTERWVPLQQFLIGTRGERVPMGLLLTRCGRLGMQLIYGAIAEFLGAQRLLPIALLKLLWGMRLATDVRPGVDDARRALAHGQPAIDYVGHGGGARLVARESA